MAQKNERTCAKFQFGWHLNAAVSSLNIILFSQLFSQIHKIESSYFY